MSFATATRLTDLVVPTLFTDYVIERTPQLSALWESGIIADVPQLAGFVADGGNGLTMPFYKDLSGESQILSASGGELTVSKITTATDQSTVLARANAWGTNELAGALAGTDPMNAIVDLLAGWWARDMQRILLAVLKGVFAAASMSNHVLNVSATLNNQMIDGENFLDALQLLGDAKDKLTAVAMHSATETCLAKQNLIDYVRVSDAQPRVPFFMGKRVIVDDSMPNTAGVFDTYLFGQGAIGFADGTGRTMVTGTEVDRNSLAGEDIIIQRRHFCLHPRGVKFTGTSVEGGPTNTELGTGTNWNRVYEDKNIRMAVLRHKLADSAS